MRPWRTTLCGFFCFLRYSRTRRKTLYAGTCFSAAFIRATRPMSRSPDFGNRGWVFVAVLELENVSRALSACPVEFPPSMGGDGAASLAVDWPSPRFGLRSALISCPRFEISMFAVGAGFRELLARSLALSIVVSKRHPVSVIYKGATRAEPVAALLGATTDSLRARTTNECEDQHLQLL